MSELRKEIPNYNCFNPMKFGFQYHLKILNFFWVTSFFQEQYATWFFEYVFCLAVVSIVSGTVVERCQFLVNLILPIVISSTIRLKSKIHTLISEKYFRNCQVGYTLWPNIGVGRPMAG